MRIEGVPEFKFYKTGIFRITKGFTVYHNNEMLVIPAGVLINGATIPKFLTWILDPFHKEYFIPSIAHDCLVGEFDTTIPLVDITTGKRRYLTWKESSVFFREMMKISGAGKFKQRLFYHAVMLKKRIGWGT